MKNGEALAAIAAGAIVGGLLVAIYNARKQNQQNK